MKRTLSLLLLAAALVIPGTAGAGNPGEPTSPGELLTRAEERFRTLTDYECVADAESRLGKKSSAGTYRIWFKQPAMLRTRVLRGEHRGSEIAVDREGRIRGRKGGLLKPFVIRLRRDDGRLRSLRGVPVFELDWGSFYRKCRERGAQLGARMTLMPRAAPDRPYEIEVIYREAENRVRHLYRIDPQLLVLVEGDIYENDVLVDHIAFREIRLNTGLSDSKFEL